MTDRTKGAIAGLIAAIAIVILATSSPSRSEYDPDLDPEARAACLMQLLQYEGHDTLPSWEYGLVLLDYADLRHGGPCAAAAHHAEHGWH